MNRKKLTVRIRLLSGVIILGGLVLLGRLYQIQIVNAEQYQAKADSQYVHTKTDLYSRGSILFTTRDGTTLSAAAIQSGYVLAANPEHFTMPAEQFCQLLSGYLADGVERCTERVSAEGRTYVELNDRISAEQSEAIEALDIDGAQLYKNQWRYYPGGSLAARSIGFIGYADEGTELRGKYGLERQYDDVLFEKRQVLSVNFFAELFSNLGELVYKKDDVRTGDVVTTLEPSVARMLDSILQETNDQYESELTGAIIMDPNTGEIIAMNAVPGFDLNDRGGATIDQFRNPLVEDVYEMGSIIKPLTMAAGLDSGAILPYSTYYDAGFIEVDDYTIRNFDGRGRGTVPMQEILNQSLNTGVSWVVGQMGKDRFRDYFLSYKLGSETGIDLPNEVHGLVDNLQSPRDVEYATASFGQGIAMTPVETVRALATLGNGGKLVTPHLVKRIEYDDGEVKEVRYPEGKQVLKPETGEEISRMLSIVVDDALRNGTVALPHHTIGAKTGTAQIPDPVNGGYYEDKFLHSFFGYFPAFEPKFIIFMYTVEPKGVRYASETLTTPFMEITKFLINYYSIPPDR
ncbi:MAG: penicillin-binding protein 2 [Candidatus Kaiserbacteria bacterium]|nr:penicillin-binding protein 2 [Candidatus Kaiserbacteria bacterium]MCB9816120.1 penicillin-binding protein 2 [Candidatus Nomurabacteria bacterium]